MLHRLTETDRRLALDERRFVQGGINLDEVEVSLEEGGAFDGCDTVLLTMERDGMAPVPVRLDTMRVAVPASLMDVPGTLRFSLTGYVGDEVRATTERMRADKCGRVVPSGIIGGGPAPQDAAPDLWKQLMDEVDAATAGAEETLERAEGAAKSAEGAASDAAAASSSAADSESKASAAASAASDSASSAASSAGTAADFATVAGNAKTEAETAKTDAESARDAAETAKTGAESAKTAAEAAKAAAEQAETDAESAKTSAEGSATSAATSAQQASASAEKAAASAQTASEKATSVLDHYIESATATTLGPGSEATATVADKVLRLGIPRGEAATVSVGSVTTGEPGTQAQVVDSGTPGAAVLDFTIPRGDPGDVSAVTAAEGSDISVSTDEGTVTIDDSALRERIAELEQQTQNVVTGISTGLVSHGEDAFPQKPREVRIKGKTWVNRWPVFNASESGVTFSTDETGLITISGTATANIFRTAGVRGTAPSKQYSLSVSSFPSGVNQIYMQTSSGGVVSEVCTITNLTGTSVTGSTPSSYDSASVVIFIDSGQTVNASFRVMLVDGTEVPDCFTPPASIASVETGKLVTAGKNLLPAADITDAGGSNNATEYVDLLPGTYTISAQGGPFSQIIVRGDDGTDYSVENYNTSNATFTLNRSARVRVLFWIPDAAGVFASNPQLELGSTATAYEPPTITTTPLPEVELRSLPNGTCDELVIKAGGTCKVERKTVQVTFDGSEDEGWIQYRHNTSAFTATCIGFFADSPINATTYNDTAIAVVCRELPVIAGGFGQSVPCVSVSYSAPDRLYVTAPSTVTDIDSFKRWLADNPVTCVVNVTGKPDEPQSPVTLPALPAPTFNVYHDGDISSDTTVTYERDLNIVIDNLAKQIAGTAATVAINEATR